MNHRHSDLLFKSALIAAVTVAVAAVLFVCGGYYAHFFGR
jgi:hypothetical protein